MALIYSLSEVNESFFVNASKNNAVRTLMRDLVSQDSSQMGEVSSELYQNQIDMSRFFSEMVPLSSHSYIL